jgi:hypothetical protein
MHKLLISVAAAAALGTAPGWAQQQSLSEAVAASDVAAMLSEFGITTQLRASQPGAIPSLVASTPGGAKFLVGFFDCADAAKPAGCKQVMVSTAQSSGGVAFEDLNNFNGQSSVTTVVYEPTNQILIFGRNIFMPGGVGRENFKLQVALFLKDMQTFVESRRASTKSVSLGVTPKLKSKITAMTADETDSASALAISHDRSAEVEMAISNSLDVDYAVDAR